MSELRITDCPTNDICELYLKLAEQIEAYKQADHEASEIIAELKHENKRLQEENDELKDRCEDYLKQLNALKPENKLLHKEIKKLQKENEELKKRQITKNGFICDCEQNTKYKQALEEIRNIVETPIIPDKNRFDEITNKINEVLDENNI